MIIRNSQIKELQRIPIAAFEDNMVLHLQKFSPVLTRVLGEEQVRESVRFGMKRAEGYSFTLKGTIRLFLEMMYLFGSRFDRDPQYPWASELLESDAREMERAELLREKTIEYQESVSGDKNENTRRALKRLHELAKNPLSFSGERFSRDELMQETERVFPEKFSYVGKDRIEQILRAGYENGRELEFPTYRGSAMLVILMFAFGRGCLKDPLYPWIQRTIEDDKIRDASAREKRLEKKAVTWLEHVLADTVPQ